MTCNASHFDLMYVLNTKALRLLLSSRYIVEELMETDLSRIIQSDQNLSVEHIQYFLFQVLSGLKYIHAAGVIHGDIKPEKLLVNSNCDTKITGFGLACPADGASSDSSSMTDFVSNRWYHAPELLLSSKEYTAAIDMWSVGCILAELFCRKPLFPGQNFLHQIHLIIEKLGSPSLDDIQFITSEKARDYVKSLSPDTEIELSSCFPEASLEALDLLDKLLQFNPARRISASEALKHPFLKNHYDLNEHEPGVPSFDFSFEDDKLSLQQLSSKDLNFSSLH